MTLGRCKYPECKHTSANSSCRFHLLPADHQKCRIWMRLCKFDGTPRLLPARIQICSCHFEGLNGPTKNNPNPIAYEPDESQSPPFQWKKFKKNVKSPDNPSTQKVNDFIGDAEETSENVDDPGTPKNMGLCTPHGESGPPTATAKDSFDNDEASVKQTITPLALGQGKFDSFDDAFSSLPPDTPEGKGKQEDSHELTEDFQDLKLNIRRRLKEMNTTEINNSRLETKEDATVQYSFALFSYEQSNTWKEQDFLYFTGLKRESFEILFDLLQNDNCEKLKYKKKMTTPLTQRETKTDVKDKLFLTLVRLRRGFSLTDMRMLFNLSESWISDIFNTWIRLLSIKFQELEEVIFVSAKAQEKNKPDCYAPFPNLRCVVDSTDIKFQKPENMKQQINMYSKYKAGNVVKFLVATSVYGGLSYISKGVEGAMTDRQLFLKCGIMDHLTPGDAVMCDRGFDIEADLNEIEVELIVPPFLGSREHFTAREILEAKAIASSRIHVETFIGRIKFFKLVRHVVPNTMIDVVSDIVKVCANLVNFSNPYINWDSVKNKVKKTK